MSLTSCLSKLPFSVEEKLALRQAANEVGEIQAVQDALDLALAEQKEISDIIIAAMPELGAKLEVTKAKQALDAANITGKDRTDTIAAVRRGDLTAEDVVESHLVLESQTNEDIATKEQAQKAADQAKRDEEARAKADAEPFTLTGSNREADVAMAHGQQDLLAKTIPSPVLENQQKVKEQAQAEQPAEAKEPGTTLEQTGAPYDTSPLSDSLAKYEDTGEFMSVNDLVNDVDRLIGEDLAPDSLQEAVDDYRREQADDRELSGRGDMESADEAFIAAVRAEINKVALEQKQEQYNETSQKATDIYAGLDARPDTTDEQRRVGRDAYREVLGPYADRAGISLLGSRIAKDFREQAGSALVGQVADTHEDLAVLAQVLRDPRFETFRIFFTKAGKIVGHTGITSRLPGAVNIVTTLPGESPDESLARLAKDFVRQQEALGADGYWMLHNHPQGRAMPSKADQRLTEALAGQIKGFLGHVVIDHNEYATIDNKGNYELTDIAMPYSYSEEPEIPHNALGEPMFDSDGVMKVGKMIQRRDGFFTLIGRGSSGYVTAIAEVPVSLLEKGGMKRLRLVATLRRFALQTGSSKIVAVANRGDTAVLTKMVERGLLMDVVAENYSARNYVAQGMDSLFGEAKSIRVEQSGQEQQVHLLQDKYDVSREEARQMYERGDRIDAKGNKVKSNALYQEDAGYNIIGDTGRARTPEQLAAFRNVGRSVVTPTIKERMQGLWKDAGKKLAQGLVDQFRPIKDLSTEAYALMRLSKGASGAFEVMLNGGQLKLNEGVYDFDEDKKGGVVDRLLIPLQGEADDFLWWVAANRAEKLSKEDREHLFTPEDIAAMKTLADGETGFDFTLQNGQTTRNRTEIYADSLKTFNEFNKNTLDMAEQSGLIDAESRPLWESEFYVPFYRVEEDGVRGMNIKSGVVRQQAFKKLKGGTEKLNSDLLDNTLMNWAHLLDAAAKNRAAKASLEAAERVGVATEVTEPTKKSVWFMDEGQKRHFVVDDPYVLDALVALEYAGMKNPVMNAMGTMKHALTVGVTASPFFKVRNLIRDSMQSIAVSGLDYNAAANIKEGWKLTNPKSDAYFRLVAGGGTIHFGTMFEGSESRRVRSLVEAGVDESTILDNESKYMAFYKRMIEPSITAYNELGNRGEAVNRASLYDQLIKQGVGHAQASLMARDLLDFSMQGAWTSIRFLNQTVPFLNARLQGLYKLGRSAHEDPRRMGIVLGATALASIALMLAYTDDDDWKKREDWDRDNYWWFKIGGEAFRIPKPFEIGAIASLAERGVELFASDEMTGKRFMDRFEHLLWDNLSMNPVPQLVKPILDVYANKDSFTGRPIETMGMERLDPEYRFTQRTSMASRGASTILPDTNFTSPVQIDHLIRGYFGWLGTFVVGSADVIAKPTTGQTPGATPDYIKSATGGMVSGLEDAPSRYVSQMYDQAKEIEQAYGTWRHLLKVKPELAEEYKIENADLLRRYRITEVVKRIETNLNQRIRMIERSEIAPEEKRLRIRALNAQKDAVARKVVNAQGR